MRNIPVFWEKKTSVASASSVCFRGNPNSGHEYCPTMIFQAIPSYLPQKRDSYLDATTELGTTTEKPTIEMVPLIQPNNAESSLQMITEDQASFTPQKKRESMNDSYF